MNFDIQFFGNTLETFDEGVEFGFRNLNHDREWIPLVFYRSSQHRRNDDIRVGSEWAPGDHFVNIRGYNVFVTFIRNHSAELKLCGKEILYTKASLSFRWLQTVISSRANNSDAAYLDNVRITIFSPEQDVLLFNDNFNSETVIK